MCVILFSVFDPSFDVLLPFYDFAVVCSYLKFGVVVWNCVRVLVARRRQVLVQPQDLFQLDLRTS